jgi:hypothetical protein
LVSCRIPEFFEGEKGLLISEIYLFAHGTWLLVFLFEANGVDLSLVAQKA